MKLVTSQSDTTTFSWRRGNHRVDDADLVGRRVRHGVASGKLIEPQSIEILGSQLIRPAYALPGTAALARHMRIAVIGELFDPGVKRGA
jgi:hypothetical protein